MLVTTLDYLTLVLGGGGGGGGAVKNCKHA